LSLEAQALLCFTSTVTVGGEVRSRIVPWFERGEVITTPRHQVDVIVTEYGAAELQGKTVHQRGEALAAVAHPDFREGLLEAAARASHRASPLTRSHARRPAPPPRLRPSRAATVGPHPLRVVPVRAARAPARQPQEAPPAWRGPHRGR